MDKLIALLNTYMAAATKVLTKFAPQVWNASLHLIQLHAAFDLLARLAGTAFLVAIPIVLAKSIHPKHDEHDYYFDKANKKVLLIIVSFAVALISFVIWFNSFNDWLGLLAPQLFVLMKVAIKAGLM